MLDEDTSKYIARVLRLKPGAPIFIFNEQDGEFEATVTSVERRSTTICLGQACENRTESPIHLTLIQGVSRGERMDYTLQKSTELGVNAIIPLITERSVVKLEEDRATKKHKHWQSILISACEQCGRANIPTITTPATFEEWLEGEKKNTGDIAQQPTRLVLDPLSTNVLSNIMMTDHNVSLLIGPEGGLSPHEISSVKNVGFIPVKIGPRILRTETASIAAIAAIQTLWGDFSRQAD